MLSKPIAEEGSARTDSLFSQFGHSLSDTEKDILNLLGAEPMLLDDMVRALNMEIGTLAGILSKMEIKGLVKQLPGKYFCCSYSGK
jgi:predicted Rossmann fold nucleotide-binding protein DprA/Smf involved in DNA uptake